MEKPKSVEADHKIDTYPAKLIDFDNDFGNEKDIALQSSKKTAPNVYQKLLLENKRQGL